MAKSFKYLDSLESLGIVLGLDRVKGFLQAIGRPEAKFKVIHIAGTNGKGSTAAILASILRAAGLKTGLYTSPHLVKVNERIQVNGEQISDSELVKLVSELKQSKENQGIKLTHFEFVTALAFQHFANLEVDIAVVEVGLGGRLDATNVVTPEVSVITNIEKEHEEFLGKTVEKIAGEKAGIVKPGVPVVTAEWKEPVLRVIRKVCKEKNAPLSIVNKPFEGTLGLQGSFQRWNAATALAVVDVLRKQGVEIDEDAVSKGLSSVMWPGRFEVVQKNPTVLLDCCHNPSGAFVLTKSFQEAFPEKKAVLVIGVSSGKNISAIAANLSPVALKVIACEASYHALPAVEISREFEGLGKECEVVLGVGSAVEKAISEAGAGGMVLVCGSCFVVGEAEQLFSK
ncbi:MAG: folylpolyglutamate synthase/dihydrofolate synthase family protein [archaeon]|nr:folylpolyglutamate synthase/dihydrofolate synthase family protein [archaeon]